MVPEFLNFSLILIVINPFGFIQQDSCMDFSLYDDHSSINELNNISMEIEKIKSDAFTTHIIT